MIKNIDNLLSRIYCKYSVDKPVLVILLFHSIFRDRFEIGDNLDPQQSVTVSQFEQFIENFKKSSFRFISPQTIDPVHTDQDKCVMITFDDGYCNNHRILPILNKYEIPATFFISTSHVIEQKSYWWDVVYRGRKKQQISLGQIRKEQRLISRWKYDRIEEYLWREFGERSMQPNGDLDRPFTETELAQFAKEKWVVLGNHTRHHAILPNYSPDEMIEEIQGGQDDLVRISGSAPDTISYPSGRFNDEVVRVTQELGFKWGITLVAKQNYLPITPGQDRGLRLNRFILWGGDNIETQCEAARSNLQLYATVKYWLLGR